MTTEPDPPEYGYRPSSIVLAGTTTTAPETAELLGVTETPDNDIDVVLLMNPQITSNTSTSYSLGSQNPFRSTTTSQHSKTR